MTITLTPETEARLREKAAREGQEPDAVAEALLAEALGHEPAASAEDESLRPFGLCAGEFVVPDDFDAPLPEDTLALFEGR
jgi:hypothetical protein